MWSCLYVDTACNNVFEKIKERKKKKHFSYKYLWKIDHGRDKIVRKQLCSRATIACK